MLQEGNIILRAPGESDEASLAVLANNKKISCYLRDHFPFPYSLKDAAFFISLIKNQVPVTTFAIELDKNFCGIISLVPQNDVYRKTAELGYWLGEPFWNKGIITTCITLITNYGFNQLELVRIYAGIFDGNIGSMRALEKNGFIKEGISKKGIFKDGKIFDEHRYAITI